MFLWVFCDGHVNLFTKNIRAGNKRSFFYDRIIDSAG